MSDTLEQELVVLEETLEHMAKCESDHNPNRYWPTECSVEVTHLFRYGHSGESGLVCLNIATRSREFMSAGLICAQCQLPLEECWSVVPV